MVKFFDIYDAILICGFLDKDIVEPYYLYGITYANYIEYCEKWHKVRSKSNLSVCTEFYSIPIYLIKEATANEGMDDIVKQNNELLEKAKKHKKFKSKFYLWMNYV